ncbi:hypothetical protein JKF63_06013 [Porcisia hertigi]|uniref:C2 domain-containing protein n=1 Tax=Porcisia hertigi TaxID=2761500 RepID=A0A836LFM3_9TRYP|nr:hypothetical protein JKF63_06013 [Porcisia hertigi]
MVTLDVTVECVSNISGVSLSKSFCVYVRLQGQSVRTKISKVDHTASVEFGENFRFQYVPDRFRTTRNRLFVELWTQSLFWHSCVTVAWLEMDQECFVCGQPRRVALCGSMNEKSSTVHLVITPVNFNQGISLVHPAVPVYGQPVQGIPLEPNQLYPGALYLPDASPPPPLFPVASGALRAPSPRNDDSTYHATAPNKP